MESICGALYRRYIIDGARPPLRFICGGLLVLDRLPRPLAGAAEAALDDIAALLADAAAGGDLAVPRTWAPTPHRCNAAGAVSSAAGAHAALRMRHRHHRSAGSRHRSRGQVQQAGIDL